jgi:dGTPase
MSSVMTTREMLESHEADYLAPYAVLNIRSRGRVYPEAEHPYRTRFQRDRDRIIHSAAFRRLKHKTQVFAAPDDDHFRTRLTHTMEVAQISRTIAKTLRLNEDLAEAIALVHDLGHPPFGHAGEAALEEILKNDGGFNHNAQSLRVVDILEDRYPHFAGLNLTYETREGIVKHETDYDLPVESSFDPHLRSSLEGQLVNLADEIAYNAHDVDDGFFSGFLTLEELMAVPVLERLNRKSIEQYGDLPAKKRHYHLIRLLIDRTVSDLLRNTGGQIERQSIRNYDDVVRNKENVVKFSDEVEAENRELKKFLFERFYRHPSLMDSNAIARKVITDLFGAYQADLALLKDKYRLRCSTEPIRLVVKDYIAGMTDRFALQEHRRIIGSIVM